MASVVPEHMTAPSSAAPPMKVWQVWHGTHSFFCDGRIMVGPDIGVTIFAFLLTTSASATFWVFVCSSLPLLFVVIGVALYVQTVCFMAATATTDPGILPHNRSMDKAEAEACAAEQRSVEVNGMQVPLKWCRTCRIWRPPRAAHCSECNVCVERFDHHCPWMGQCIGRRNYRFFLGFVNSVVALCCYTLVLSGYMCFRMVQASASSKTASGGSRAGAHAVDSPVARAIDEHPAALVLVVLTCLIILCVGPLACYHCSLVCNNTTTAEEVKETFADANPFSRGCAANCSEACCDRREPPRVLPRALASEPERVADTCHLIGDGQKEHEEDARGAKDGLRTGPQDTPLPAV